MLAMLCYQTDLDQSHVMVAFGEPPRRGASPNFSATWTPVQHPFSRLANGQDACLHSL